MNKVQLMVGDTVKVLRSSIASGVRAGDVGVVIQSVKETKTNSVRVMFEHLAAPVSLLQSEVSKCKSRKVRKDDAVVILAQQGFGERAIVSSIEEDTIDGTVVWVIRNGIMPQYEYAASLVRLLPKREEKTMSIHVCACENNGKPVFHLFSPGMTEREALELADKINGGALSQSKNKDKVKWVRGDHVLVTKSHPDEFIQTGAIGVVLDVLSSKLNNQTLVIFKDCARLNNGIRVWLNNDCLSFTYHVRDFRRGDLVLTQDEQVCTVIVSPHGDQGACVTASNGETFTVDKQCLKLLPDLPPRVSSDNTPATDEATDEDDAPTVLQGKELIYGDSDAVPCGVGLVLSMVIEPQIVPSDYVICYGINDRSVSLFSLKLLQPISMMLNPGICFTVKYPKSLTKKEFDILIGLLPENTRKKGITIKGRLNAHVYDPNQEG